MSLASYRAAPPRDMYVDRTQAVHIPSIGHWPAEVKGMKGRNEHAIAGLRAEGGRSVTIMWAVGRGSLDRTLTASETSCLARSAGKDKLEASQGGCADRPIKQLSWE